MMLEWLVHEGRERLIVFYNGWGMDSCPFRPLKSKKYDIAVYSDYSDQHGIPDIGSLRKKYGRCVLVSWSMGVLYGQLHFSDQRELFDKKVAINGTLLPVDDRYGIPWNIFNETLDKLSPDSLKRFYRRMCRSPKVLESFLQNRPLRKISGLKAELEKISKTQGIKSEDKSIYTDVIVADRDYIIPTESQLRFWKTSRVCRIDAAHFPFYTWESWDEILELT